MSGITAEDHAKSICYVVEVYLKDRQQLLVIKARNRHDLMLFGPLGSMEREGYVIDGFRILDERPWNECIAGIMFDSEHEKP